MEKIADRYFLNTLRIMPLEPLQQKNSNFYNFLEIKKSAKNLPEFVKILKCLPTKNKIE